MTSLRLSLLFSAIDRYINQILLVVTTAIMARILTPAETGLFLMANTLIMLADSLRSFGIGPFIVQHHTLSRTALRSAFTLTMLISLGMCALILGTAEAVGRYYDQPALAGLLRIAAVGFLAGPFGGPSMALLQRDLAFGRLAVVNTAAVVASATVTIWLGLSGIGAASYVWGYVALGVVSATLAFAMRPEPWVFRPSLREVGGFFSFGAVSSSVAFVNLASEFLPRLVFGKLLGFDAVGLYARAVTICQLPNRAIVQALQPVVLPAMAAHRRNGGHLGEVYLRSHAIMSAIQWPALLMLALLAGPAVRVLLGPQWDAVPPLARVIALGTMALAPDFMSYPVLVATGRIRDTLLTSLISLPPSVAITITAAHFGLWAVAASLLVVAPWQMLVSLVVVRRAIDLRWRDLVKASRASVVLALGTGVGPLGILLLFSPDGYSLGVYPTLAAVALGAAGWLTALRLVRHPIGPEIVDTGRAIAAMVARTAGRRAFGRG